jgi:aspartyl-tRNA(Asn)/glutamyl-tRNA(Gln) amidotransferase subunit C
MPVTPEQIQYVAALARLRLSQVEIIQLSAEVSSVLSYAAKLQQVKVAAPELKVDPISGEIAGRDDIVRPSLASHEALSNAPQCDGDYFLVPRVIG